MVWILGRCPEKNHLFYWLLGRNWLVYDQSFKRRGVSERGRVKYQGRRSILFGILFSFYPAILVSPDTALTVRCPGFPVINHTKNMCNHGDFPVINHTKTIDPGNHLNESQLHLNRYGNIEFTKNFYNCQNIIKDKTCFKNPYNPPCIDLIITNR